MSKDLTPPSLPLPAPHAMRKGRAVRVRLAVPREYAWVVVALGALIVVALWALLHGK